MKRRDLIRSIIGSSMCCSCQMYSEKKLFHYLSLHLENDINKKTYIQKNNSIKPKPVYKPEQSKTKLSNSEKIKMQAFDQTHPGDIIISAEKMILLKKCLYKLKKTQSYIGHAHYNLLSFDQFINYGKYAIGLEKPSKEELTFLEEIFYFDANKYGFYGKKLITDLNYKISDSTVSKIPYSGHYLLKENSLSLFKSIQKDLGESIILTSGVRNIIKQMQLFLEKAHYVSGNLSQASRSLAPPGYSYHAVGDFDVGKKGLGHSNFTDDFSKTSEYKHLISLGYIDIRYPSDNIFGVRFEPWHIEGAGRA